MNYYLVKCKFGHVGRNKYLPLYVPVMAESMKKAVELARNVGGVKRDHKDWCLEVPKQLTKEEYNVYSLEFKSDVYFKKHSRSRLWLFEDRLVDEPNYTRVNGIKTNKKNHSKSRDKEVIAYKHKRENELKQSLMKFNMKEILNTKMIESMRLNS
jgi:hypothetical protein